MRGSDRHGDVVRIDLLSEWTDPDTAIEAMGSSLGAFADRETSPRRTLAAEPALRDELHDVLLDLVERDVLDKRLCSDGRYAFRWRDESTPEPAAPAAPAVPEARDAPEVDPALSTRTAPRWSQHFAPTAPLLFPASSFLLATLAFVWFGRGVAFVIAATLMLVGVVGLVRRVPFAGFWTVGVVAAGLLLRFS